MPSYEATDKTDWFIQKMRSKAFSWRELVERAATEFPDVSRKKLEGTIGQYWSDSVNPKWPIHKTIEARGLRVVADASGRRRIEAASNVTPLGSSHPLLDGAEVTTSAIGNCFQSKSKLQAGPAGSKTREIWNSNDRVLWEQSLKEYWRFVMPHNLALEIEMSQLDSGVVSQMGPDAWYRFLLDKYFRWKYTAQNRYASTTKWLKTYQANGELPALHRIKERLFAADKNNIQQCLSLASSIRGLGTAGASGLLAVLFPTQFGTVDQFMVKALAQVPELEERRLIMAMNPESLKVDEGVVLVLIMRRKARELNAAFSSIDWTPRKVDMVLWTCGR
jgi:hypothetical protein